MNTETSVKIFAELTGSVAYRAHPSHVWEFDKAPTPRAGLTTNKRQGEGKARRKMAKASRRHNRG